MRIIQRIFLTLLMIFLIAAAAALALIACNVIPLDNMQAFVYVVYNVPINAWLIALAAVVLLVMSLVVLFGGRRKAGKQPASATALIRASDIGATYIAVSAIDTMVQKNVRSNQRVKDCHSRVVSEENCVAIHLRISLMPDTNIVELTENVQTELKKYIETLTGIIVREIHILVDSVNINMGARVD